jgi:CheY-like chemotaxis protein
MIYDYKKYLKLIKEGIIFTHNIEKYQNNLDIQLSSIGVKHKINIISKFIYDLDILNSKELSNDVLKYAININQNLLGYYPSYIWIVNEIGKNGFVFDERYLSNEFLNITIRFESKYEDGLYKNDLEIPEYAYHLSPKNKRDKILKNGNEILESSPDLILLDINIPYINGESLLQELRKISNVPVIMVTSINSETDEALSISYGADDYITKPYNPNILLLRIGAVLKRTSAESNLTSYKDLKINIQKGIIKKDDIEIVLTKNEMIIFCYLLNHQLILS